MTSTCRRVDVYDFDRLPEAELMDTVAHLQLEGDALNVALLMPEEKRATRAGLVGALT